MLRHSISILFHYEQASIWDATRAVPGAETPHGLKIPFLCVLFPEFQGISRTSSLDALLKDSRLKGTDDLHVSEIRPNLDELEPLLGVADMLQD